MNEPLKLTIKNYWHYGLETPWTIYVPLIMLAVFTILSLVAAFLLKNNEKTVIVKSLSAIYIAGIITSALTLILATILMQFSTFIAYHFCQLGFVIGLLLTSAITIASYVKLCLMGKSQKADALGVVTTSTEKQKRFLAFKTYALILWLLSLGLALPFVIFAIPNNQKQLISIVLDNSGSMSDNLYQCTQALKAAILPTHKKADYVFTTIDYNKPNFIEEEVSEDVNTLMEKGKITTLDNAWKQYTYKYYENLINQTSAQKVSTNTKVFDNIQQLFNSFAQMGIAENGSPIHEGIWQNYLISRQTAQGSSYKTKKMIIITDGYDNLYWCLNHENKSKTDRLLKKDIFQEEGKISEKAYDFYTSICTINYGDDANNWFFRDCASSIDRSYNGVDTQSYYDAFRSILPELFFDILFLYILIGYAIILSLTLLITKISIL